MRAPSIRLLKQLYRLDTPFICQQCRPYTSTASIPPLRKQLKEEARARKETKANGRGQTPRDLRLDNWELTVGIEIHAELSTVRKLFSPALTSLNADPNQHVSLFDAAVPGTQPQFQKETILPALRAALALKCSIQPRSSFDRKHYFWWDQPNGYQITQYYRPFAKDGHITLYEHDDIDIADGKFVTIGIKQVQLEQDTAKTIAQPPATQLLDFNRVSHPLIEIITLPHIHSPKTAAAVVKKIQSILKAVNANTTGMELGGLRADINVSVRQRNASPGTLTFEYAGVSGLGQRTEIKNLSSFKAVEDAIVAERDRQISVLEAGGHVEGETRGWTIGSTQTKRLRGKEGEVDYRYMPDPDLGEVVIGEDLVENLASELPMLPDELLTLLMGNDYGLSLKDAKTLVALDEGRRLEYYLEVVERLQTFLSDSGRARSSFKQAAKLAANFVLNDIPTHLSSTSAEFPYVRTCEVSNQGQSSAPVLAEILFHLQDNQITMPTARQLLAELTNDRPKSIEQIIDEDGLRLVQMTDDEYQTLARSIVEENDDMARKAALELETGKGRGKTMWLVGQMVRRGVQGKVQPDRAQKAVSALLVQPA